MSFFGTPEFKVGLLIIAVSVLIGVMSMKISENPAYLGSSKRLHFVVNDASGLIKNSPILVAGIRVGVIEDIVLEKGQARINMVVRNDVSLSKSSRIEVRASGILGDKMVVIVPGSSNDPLIADGDRVLIVDNNASMDKLMGEVSKISGSLTDIVENLRDATEGEAQKPIGKVIANIEKLSGNLSSLVDHKKGQIGELVDRMNSIAASVEQMIGDKGDSGLQASWNKALTRIDSTLENLDDIANKVNSGEGSIGKLINDESTVEELNSAISGVNGFLQMGQKIETSFDYYGHYLVNSGSLRNYFGIKLQPGLDRFYEAALVDIGGITESTERTITTDTGTVATRKDDTKFLNRVAVTILFGKKFYNFSVKGGIIENSGGVGLEYSVARNKLKFQLDAFNFREPQVRGYLRYNFFKGMYVVGGQQYHFRDGSSNPSAFVGAGLFLTNEDIKILLR